MKRVELTAVQLTDMKVYRVYISKNKLFLIM